MKKQFSLLAACLCGLGIAHAQQTTTTYSTTTSTPAYTSPTDTTNAANPSMSMSDSSSTMNNGTTNTTTTAPSTQYSTNAVNDPGTVTTTTTTETTTTDYPTRTKRQKGYQGFAFGVYAGLNTTHFKGESVNAGGDLSGRVGYQAGFFLRAGGRLFGQIGGEYFTSSSNYFTKGDGQSVQNIQDQINIQYIQVPVYIGYKLLQSDRGISAIRLQIGAEYANRINSKSGNFNLSDSEIKSGTFNGLGQLGFDIGPLLIDLTYHYGFDQSIQAVQSSGFAGSQRRILSASVGFKF